MVLFSRSIADWVVVSSLVLFITRIVLDKMINCTCTNSELLSRIITKIIYKCTTKVTLTIWREHLQNISIRWAVHVLAAFTLIRSLGYQIRTMDVRKWLLQLSHDHWAWYTSIAPKRDWCSAGRQTACSKWTKALSLVPGSTCACTVYMYVVAKIPIPDSINMFVGWAWVSPTLIMTTAPAGGIMVCLYHLPNICRTLVPKIRVRPEILCVFRYIVMLTYVIYMYNCTQQEDWSYSCLSWRLSMKTGRWMCRHMV